MIVRRRLLTGAAALAAASMLPGWTKSNWPTSEGVTLGETLGAGTGTGTTVTSGATNAKGSFATLGTTTRPWSGFLLSWENVTNATSRVDIAVGAGNQVIVEDLPVSVSATNQVCYLYIPVRIPAGVAVSARFSAGSSAATATALLTGYANDFRGPSPYSALLSFTDFTNTLPANSVVQTGNTPTAFTAVRAVTPVRTERLWLFPNRAGDNARTATDMLIDIAVGGAGSEKILGTFLVTQGPVVLAQTQLIFQMPCDIAAGSRLSFRVTCSNNAAADSLSVGANGLAA